MRLNEITPELKEKDRISKLLKRLFQIDDYIIDGGLVYTRGNCTRKDSKSIFDELPVKFGKVFGNFAIHDMGLITLNGCPDYIGGAFRCYNNNLMTLEGGPTKVDGIMSAANNHLTSLTGAPEEVGGVFICRNNILQNLVGAPLKTGGFQCDNNPLTSLEGLPKEINGPLNLTYMSILPVLRIVMSSGITSVNFDGGRNKKLFDLSEILMKYIGQGRKGAIQCAAELSKAGFKGNAHL